MKKQKEDNVDSNTLNEQQLEQAEEVSSILTNDHNEELVNDISNDLIQEVENEGSKKEINFN